jgi:hypothetical protein
VLPFIALGEVSRHKSLDTLRGYVRRVDLFKDWRGAFVSQNTLSVFLITTLVSTILRSGAAMAEPVRRPEKSSTARADVVAQLDRIYDLRRNCLLNELYYGRRLHRFSGLSFWLEVWIVIGSGTSGVSGWVIWTTYPQLKAVWAAIAAIAVLLATLKPVLQMEARIRRYSVLFAGYRQLSMSMADVVENIAEARGVTTEIERDVNRMRTRYRTLAGDDDPRPSTKLVRELQSEVNERVPITSLFYPSSADTSHPHSSTSHLEDEAVAPDQSG